MSLLDKINPEIELVEQPRLHNVGIHKKGSGYVSSSDRNERK